MDVKQVTLNVFIQISHLCPLLVPLALGGMEAAVSNALAGDLP
jgi:hypothetical protein